MNNGLKLGLPIAPVDAFHDSFCPVYTRRPTVSLDSRESGGRCLRPLDDCNESSFVYCGMMVNATYLDTVEQIGKVQQ